MKKTLDELIQLARLAPRIEPGDDNESTKTYTSVIKFMKISGLAAGRNLVPKDAVYQVYSDWAEDPMPEESFYTKLSKIVKTEKGKFKLNMHVTTLINNIGEANE